MGLIDLPEIDFVDADVTATLNNVLQVHSAVTGRTLAAADPERMILQTLCAIIVQQRVLINQTAKATLLRYAFGPGLEHIGAHSELERLPASAAKTTVRFTLSAPQQSVVTIPAGTRISTQGDPKRYFATTQIAEITAGNTTVDVVAECTELGILGNDFLSGQINQIVDPIAFVASATNLTTSSGGAEIESDDAFRQRIYEAPESFSVAGPDGAYNFWARTADPTIIDVDVSSPADGEILIVPLLIGGEIPSQTILDAVLDACNSKTVRPLTDKVSAAAPTVQNYTVEFTYYIARSRAAEVTAIQAAVQQATADFVLWQKSKLGRDVNPSELVGRLRDAGAFRITVINPVYAAVDSNKVAVMSGNATITYGGLTDD